MTNKAKIPLMLGMLSAMNGGKIPDLGIDLSLPKAPPRPWAMIDIPKAVRKGKTFEEIDALKKEIWENQNVPNNK